MPTNSVGNPTNRFSGFLVELTDLTKYTFVEFENRAYHQVKQILGNEHPFIKYTKEKSEMIAKAFLAIGTLYHFYKNPLPFLGAFIVGGLASKKYSQNQCPSLTQGPLFGCSAKDSYAAPKVILSLAAFNVAVGQEFMIDLISSIFSGFLLGNSFLHLTNRTQEETELVSFSTPLN